MSWTILHKLFQNGILLEVVLAGHGCFRHSPSLDCQRTQSSHDTPIWIVHDDVAQFWPRVISLRLLFNFAPVRSSQNHLPLYGNAPPRALLFAYSRCRPLLCSRLIHSSTHWKWALVRDLFWTVFNHRLKAVCVYYIFWKYSSNRIIGVMNQQLLTLEHLYHAFSIKILVCSNEYTHNLSVFIVCSEYSSEFAYEI